MNNILEELINKNNKISIEEIRAILRELLQRIILIGLSKSGFFSKASFYGGTALRIFYGLNRYSEDLDFTLNEMNSDFSLEPYINSINEVAKSYGLNLSIETRLKKIKTPIESAFAKLNTYEALIGLNIDEKAVRKFNKNELVKVKFEVDCTPPLGFTVEEKCIIEPEFASAIVLDKPSLFAGKIHAVLCREYKNNVKGRDYYDFLFYVKMGVSPNLTYLKNKLVDSNILKEEDELSIELLREMLHKKMEKIDFNLVKNDASRFVFRTEDLSFYSKEIFDEAIDRLK